MPSTPSASYLTRRRIERAQDLLCAANLTVTEVCTLVGFASSGSFSSRFTQLVGESPTASTATGGWLEVASTDRPPARTDAEFSTAQRPGRS